MKDEYTSGLKDRLKKIENLSRYAEVQVARKPKEAEELFKMIHAIAKGDK